MPATTHWPQVLRPLGLGSARHASHMGANSMVQGGLDLISPGFKPKHQSNHNRHLRQQSQRSSSSVRSVCLDEDWSSNRLEALECAARVHNLTCVLTQMKIHMHRPVCMRARVCIMRAQQLCACVCTDPRAAHTKPKTFRHHRRNAWKPKAPAIFSASLWQRFTRCRNTSKRWRKAAGGPCRRNDASGALRRTMSRKLVALESMT